MATTQTFTNPHASILFSTFVIFEGKEGRFLTPGDCHTLYHPSLLQRLKGLVTELCVNSIFLEWNTYKTL